MATNKKKAAKEKPVVGLKSNQPNSQENAPETMQPAMKKQGLFLSAQFTTVILLAMGVWRLLELRSASLVESSKPCIAFLGEDACQDSLILSLLSFKFHLTIPVTILVLLFVVLTWNTDSMLAHINALLVLSPIMAGMAVLLGNLSIIPYKAAKGQCIPAIVLALLSIPPQQNQPFSGLRVTKWQTVPNLIFAMLVLASLAQALHCLLDSYDRGSDFLQPWPLHLVTIQPVARPILQFFAVDHFLMGLLYAYAWYSFPDPMQRTLLISLTMMKLGEGFYLLPMFGDTLNIGVWQSMAIGTSLLCAVGYMSPRS